MSKTVAITLFLVAGLMVSSNALAAPINYTLDGGFLAVLVRYDRSALISGSDHVVLTSEYSGTVTWDAENVGACKVHIEFPVTALKVDPGGSRKKWDLKGETSDGDKKQIKKELASKSQLDADKYPRISFDSTSCTSTDSHGASVTGNLNIHGVSKPVTVSMLITAKPDSFSARGSFKSTHRNWGFKPWSALTGALLNDDALEFRVSVSGRP